MLGKYIVGSFQQEKQLCLINYGRSKCQKCDLNIKGDLRDSRHVERMVKAYKPETILTSVKPPLLGIHYKTYIELNMLSMIELIKIAKGNGVKNFIYVSSIAASGHYHWHHNANEKEEQPLYTDYEAPYDISKRVAEDYLLAEHEEGKFNVISIRTGGIIGGKGDPYDYMRYPVLGGFEPAPPRVDSNFAGNIADALVVVYKKMKQDAAVAGCFYYYTGEPVSETDKIRIVAKATGKPLIILPSWVLYELEKWWTWARWNPNEYTNLDLLRMGLIEQTFDQTKFFETFKFKPKITLKEAIKNLYAESN